MCNIQNTEISITLVHGQNRFLIDAYFVVDIEELGGVTSRLFHWVWSPTGLPPPLPSSFPENAFRMFWVVPPALRSTIAFWESLLFTLQFGVDALYEYILRNSTFTTAHLNIALREAVKNYFADCFRKISGDFPFRGGGVPSLSTKGFLAKWFSVNGVGRVPP